MSAETLRRAAALMRDRATSVTGGDWEAGERCVWASSKSPSVVYTIVSDGEAGDGGAIDEETADHIASWPPDVALAVADWLDSTANDVEHVHTPVYNLTSTTVTRAHAVARAYLGGDDSA